MDGLDMKVHRHAVRPRRIRARFPGTIGVRILLFFGLLGGGTAIAAAGAGHAPEVDTIAKSPIPGWVPPELRPYVPWILHGLPNPACPSIDAGSANDGICVWPGVLRLVVKRQVSEQGASSFSQPWRAFDAGWGSLPGDAAHWPERVTVDGAKVIVVSGDKGPRVWLLPGDHVVQGVFSPAGPTFDSIQVPDATGIVALELDGEAVPFPTRHDGSVWLQEAAPSQESEDRVDVHVRRKIIDDVPLEVVTQVELHVSGKSRELLLGGGLIPGTLPLSLTSPIPARIEPDGRLRAQVRPGVHTIDLVARSEGPVGDLRLPNLPGEWTAQEEWVFDARTALRVVSVEGVPSLDPQQTTLPSAWKGLPAYAMSAGGTMHLAEKRRGDAEPEPDRLTLRRQLVLDFDGKGMTASDTMEGAIHRSTRLEMVAPWVLGRAAIDQRDQLISRVDGGEGRARSGVEVTQGPLVFAAESRLDRADGALSAVGWDIDFASVAAELQLPPGYRLLGTVGIDKVSDAWIGSFSLLDFFLILVVTISCARLWGVRWGLVALAGTTLTFPEVDAPRWMWLAVLVAEALSRVWRTGRGGHWLRIARVGARIGFVLWAMPFAITQIRYAVYPALAPSDASAGGFDERTGMAQPKPASAPSPAAAESKDSPKGEAFGSGAGEPPTEDQAALPAKNRVLDVAIAARGGGAAPISPSPVSSSPGRRALAQVIDPNAIAQTGTGFPSWRWKAVQLTWNGPVDRTQSMRLFIAGPGANFVFACLRIALLALAMARTWYRNRDGGSDVGPDDSPEGRMGAFVRGAGGSAGTAAVGIAIAIGCLATFTPGRAMGDVPSPDLLAQLAKRLAEKPPCAPNCATVERVAIQVDPESVQMRMDLGALSTAAIPLPGGREHWLPTEIKLDGHSAPGLLSSGDDRIWLALTPGPHSVTLKGPLPARSTVQIPFPLAAHRVTATSSGWTVGGITQDGQVENSLQLTRIETDTADSASGLKGGNLPPFVRVVRELTLGLTWGVTTRVLRACPTGSAILADIPLLDGESVTDGGIRVEGGKVAVNLGPQQSELHWVSTLAITPKITLRAARSSLFVEIWRVTVLPIWHVDYHGIPPTHADDPAQSASPDFRPWPGEEAVLDVTRPLALDGQTLTVDHARLILTPGARATDATLTLSLRASRGGTHEIQIPKAAQLTEVTVRGRMEPLRQQGRTVTFSVPPGGSDVALKWREPSGISLRYRAPEVDLGIAGVNIEVHVIPGGNRWVLFLGGPRLGPAVLFWSLLIALVLVSLVLGRGGLTPLRATSWWLLGIGLSQVTLWLAAIVAGWLFALGLRRRNPPLSPTRFNLLQIALVAWTLVAVAVLIESVRQGLLGEPEMQIAGNGSASSLFKWYQDRTAGAMPRPWLVSVPLLFYRGAMLSWALWLAWSLLDWLKWAFACFTHGGGWRPAPPNSMARPAAPRPQSPAPAPATPPAPPAEAP